MANALSISDNSKDNKDGGTVAQLEVFIEINLKTVFLLYFYSQWLLLDPMVLAAAAAEAAATATTTAASAAAAAAAAAAVLFWGIPTMR